MNDQTKIDAGYFDSIDCDLGAFTALIDQTADSSDVPHAADVQKNVPIYDMTNLRPTLEDRAQRRAIMAEWARVLQGRRRYSGFARCICGHWRS